MAENLLASQEGLCSVELVSSARIIRPDIAFKAQRILPEPLFQQTTYWSKHHQEFAFLMETECVFCEMGIKFVKSIYINFKT
jgi:hypothetical protein